MVDAFLVVMLLSVLPVLAWMLAQISPSSILRRYSRTKVAALGAWSSLRARLRRNPPPVAAPDDVEIRAVVQRRASELVRTMVPWCGYWSCAGLFCILLVILANDEVQIITPVQWFALLFFVLSAAAMPRAWRFSARCAVPTLWYSWFMLLLTLFILRVQAVNPTMFLISVFCSAAVRVALSSAVLHVWLSVAWNSAYTAVVLYMLQDSLDPALAAALVVYEVMSMGLVVASSVATRIAVWDQAHLKVVSDSREREQEMMARLINISCEAAVEIGQALQVVENTRLLGSDSFSNFAQILDAEEEEEMEDLTLAALLEPKELNRLKSMLFPEESHVNVFSFTTMLRGLEQTKTAILLFSVADKPDGGRHILMGVRDFAAGYTRFVQDNDNVEFSGTQNRNPAMRKALQAKPERELIGTQPKAERRSLEDVGETESMKSGSTKVRIATNSKSMQLGLLELMSTWSCPKGPRDCCAFHVATGSLSRAARGLVRWKCSQVWEPEGDAQCMECGILTFVNGPAECPAMCALCDCKAVVQLGIADSKTFVEPAQKRGKSRQAEDDDSDGQATYIQPRVSGDTIVQPTTLGSAEQGLEADRQGYAL